MLLTMFFVATKISLNHAEAATKPSISKDMTIGTGSISFYNPYFMDDLNTLSVSDPVKKATYTFTSSSKKVVTVKSKGATAYLTGVKAGSATITCKQKYKGKTTKIGTCKVTVKDVKVYEMFSDLPLGASEAPAFDYSYRNCDAKYTYVSNSKNLKVVDKVTKSEEGYYYVSQTFTAKKAGTYTVTAKETYNKITRTVGKLEFTVHKASITNDDFNMDIGDTNYAYYLMENFRYDVPYYFEVKDESIIAKNGTGFDTQIEAKKVGTTTINIYENTKKAEKSKLVGSCKITVVEVILEGINVDIYPIETYVGGENIDFYISRDPYNAPGTFTVTSSDPNVATVTVPDDNGECTITAVGAGTTTITIACGDITETETITVYKDEDDYYENY